MNGFDSSEESNSRIENQTCCLIDESERCRNPAGCATYSKRIQKIVSQKRLKLIRDPTAQYYICDYHKRCIQSAPAKVRRRKDSEDSNSNETDTDLSEIPDLCQLQLQTLRRYKRYYKVSTRSGMKRDQLVETIKKHFKTIPINEKEIITYFVYMVKSNSNKLDQKKDNGIGNDTS